MVIIERFIGELVMLIFAWIQANYKLLFVLNINLIESSLEIKALLKDLKCVKYSNKLL